MGVDLLYYRTWRGGFRSPHRSVWPIARVALAMLLRRRLFWVLYGCGLLIFLMFFFGQFLLDWAVTQMPQAPLQTAARNRMLVQLLRAASFLNGGQDTFRYFFAYQGTMLVVMLTLAGSALVGNDFTFGSVPFYLAKPVSRWHYVLGKVLAVAVVVQLMTTVPALLLYAQYGIGNWDYVLDPNYFRADRPGAGPAGLPLLLGILAYGLLLGACLGVILVATASLLRRTMPMVLGWTGLFLFVPLIAAILVDVLQLGAGWRLLDLWNDLCLAGNACLGFDNRGSRRGAQPATLEAVLVLGATCILCLTYLNRRTRAVEIVA
jgi:ABC-type transport system involved in multi-copper enzyme maturation permease subunit